MKLKSLATCTKCSSEGHKFFIALKIVRKKEIIYPLAYKSIFVKVYLISKAKVYIHLYVF